MEVNLAKQMLELMKSRRGSVNNQPDHIRVGVILVQELQTFLLMKANHGVDIGDITYDLGNPRFGYLAFILSKVGVTPEQASTKDFYKMLTNYVNDALHEEGIKVKWKPHQLQFSFTQ
ncbi:hypothetical protein KXE51_003540 [Salmonella enterica]|nr:hypothetical protein [Salmonella enterica]